MPSKRIALLLSLSAALVIANLALADPPPTAPVDCSPGLAWWAVPSDTGHYLGYYVGGGAGRPHKAEPRNPDEGTWGWDYRGWLVPRRVMLGWWHGQRDQGGTEGRLQSDGPRLLYRPEEGK